MGHARERSPATIVIPAWNAWAHTRACLESLIPTLREGDQVLVLDNGSTDETPLGLGDFPRVEVVRSDVNLGFARGCNVAAEQARHDIIVFLNSDTLVDGEWLDELLAPFDDGQVGAVGPRSNNVSGAQLVDDADYVASDDASRRAFSRDWSLTHRGQVEEVAKLVGFCLAVRASAFRDVGGFDEGFGIGGYEDDDLSMRLRARRYRLYLAHGSFVHHEGHASFDANGVSWESVQVRNKERYRAAWGLDGVAPLCTLSVCLIVKNEEQFLASCLASAANVADEIIVYDTGSTDRTVEIARESGARVVQGYWDDDFARARNAVLDLAVGEWVLSIDADETLLADSRALRAMLADPANALDAYQVSIENLHGAGNSRSVHNAVRLFRRHQGQWRHRLHELVVGRGEPPRELRIGHLTGARIIHHGYDPAVFAHRNKVERNLAMSEAALGDEGLSQGYALMNYGRALEMAGRSEDAAEALERSVDLADNVVTRRLALKVLIPILTRLRRDEDVRRRIDELRRLSVSQIAADIAEGRFLIKIGQIEEGLAILARIPPRGRDDEGMEYGAHMMSAIRGEALASLGRYAEAADVVLDAVRANGVLEADLGEVATWLARAARSVAEIADALTPDELMPILGRLVRQEPAVADDILEAIWRRFPDRLEPLAAAVRLAPSLEVSRILVWSSRLRQRGLAGSCPLVAVVNDRSRDPALRVLAGAAAFGSFADASVVTGVRLALEELPEDDRRRSFDEVSRLAPGIWDAIPSVPPSAPVHEAPVQALRPTPATKAPRTKVGRISPTPRRGGINLVGPFESSGLYGDIARSLCADLVHQRTSLSTTAYHADGRVGAHPFTPRDAGDLPFDTTLLIMSPGDVIDYVLDVGSEAYQGRYVIGLWCSDYDTPPRAVATAAEMVHEIWTPSQFSAAALGRSTQRPVTVLHLPDRVDWSRLRGESVADDFTFVVFLDFDGGVERQNVASVVAAFTRAFAPSEGPRLAIHVQHADRSPAEYRALLASLDRPDVEVVSVDGDPQDDVLRGYDPERSCLVSLHRSEGTGRLFERAMCLGVPIVASRHSVSTELLDDDHAFLVSGSTRDVPTTEYACEPGATWYEPDVDEAADLMRLVFVEPEMARRRAARAQDRARRLVAPLVTVRAMRDRLASIAQGRRAAARTRVH